MAAFRILGQFTQFFLDSGNVNAGGSISTFETDLTTPKLTYSDPALTVPNPFIIPLDAAGRNEVDVWGDGAYGAVMKDALGTTIQTLNNIQSDSPVVDQIPALVAGQFLTNNGSTLLWAEVINQASPVGLAGYTFQSDGDNGVWTAPTNPDVVTAEIVTTDTSARIGNTDEDTKVQMQWGSGTAPAAPSAKATSVSVTYDIPFSVAPIPQVTTTSGYVNTNNDVQPTVSVTNHSTTGFTVQFSTQIGEANSDANIVSPVTFGWFAVSTKEVVS